LKTAVVLINLGTPNKADAKNVRRFLSEFLSDKRVVEIPRPLWLIILYCFILPFRPKKVAEAYRQTFIDGRSPLRIYSEQLAERVKQKLQQELGEAAPLCELAMTYGDDNISRVSTALIEQGVNNIIYIPLYPQYSATTTAAALDQVTDFYRKRRDICQWHWLRDYHDHPLYIGALSASVKQHWQKHGCADQLLMSFHGIPQRNIDLGDPYFEQCSATAALLAQHLDLSPSDWQLSFQSRLGRAQWLQPYSIDAVKQMGEKGMSTIDVIAPAFAVDCVETLEEISMELAEEFTHAGGNELRYIPCLNAEESHQLLMISLIKPFLALNRSLHP
jgi:ferrochelatase